VKDPNSTTQPELENLDPRVAQDTTESGELERPLLRRKIDCAGTPEVVSRGPSMRGGSPNSRRA